MLGQMGQAMALKAASQDIQGNEALREFYAQGGDTSTAEGRRQLMARTGAIGSKIIGQQSEISARDVKTQADSLKAIKDNVSLVNSPEGMVEFLRGAYSTPGGALLAKLAPLDKAIAAIPTDPKAFADYKRNLGLTSDRLFESADAQLSSKTSLATAGMTAQTAANRLSFDERGRAYDRANPTLTPIQGSYQIPDQNAPGGFRQVEGFGGFNTRTGTVTPAQIRAAAAAPTLANSLAAAQPAPVANNNVNALNPNFITSAAPASPVVPSAAATAPSASAAVPSAALPTTAAQAGVFRPKPSPQAEKQAQDEIERKRGKVEVANIIGGLASKYTNLASTGGMTSTNKGVLENIGSYLANTALGQEAGKMTATQEQSLRNEIRAQSPVLLQGIKKATGMTAKEMDSNADVKRWMEAMGSTTFDVQATLGILKSLNAQFGSGNEIPAAPANTGNIASDPAIQSLINKYSK
jgi:hypothetical protein